MRIGSAVVLAHVVLVGAVRLDAQVVRGEVALGAGVSTDQRGIKSSAVTITPSVLLAPDPRFSASASVSGTRFGGESQAIAGTLGAGTRLPLGNHFALSGSGFGQHTRTSFDASYSLLDLTPTLEASAGTLTLFGGAHIASGSTTLRQTVNGTAPLPGVPAPTAGTRDVTVTRSSAGPVFGGVLNIAGSDPSQATLLFYREERARVDRVALTDRSASATFTSGTISVALSAGVRDASDEKTGFGSVSAAVALSPSLTLQGSAGAYPSNRVLGTMRGNYASIGVAVHGSRRVSEAPALRGAPAVPAGMTRLTLRAPDASRVEIAGDWSGWKLVPASRAENGMWYADVKLTSGDYRYAFKVDGQRWVVPEGVSSVDDGFGGRSGMISIR